MEPGDRIKRAWKKSGLVQRVFAERLGVTVTTLRNWMRPPDNAAYREPNLRAVLAAEHVAESMALTAPRR